MFSYLFRRTLLVIPTFIGVTIMVFSITRVVPGGPLENMIAQMYSQSDGVKSISNKGNNILSEEQMHDLRVFYGLDKPFFPAYISWLVKIVKFDLGESTRYYDPVSDMILERLPVSIFYGAITFLLSYLISIPLGYYKALKHNDFFDSSSSVLIFIGYALPGYVLGVLLISYFSFSFEWFPIGGFTGDDFDDLTPWGKLKDILWHAVLPLACYVIGDFAVLTMTMKNNLMENMSTDYIRTAVSKGLTFEKAVKRHAFRNSLIPIASHFGNSLLFFMTGSFLIEVIFDIDGMGLLGYESIMQRDYPVVMGIVAVNAIILLLGNIISDFCVALVDPRVRFRKLS